MDTLIRPEILYEDNHIIVAIKPAGVLSQSDGSDAPDMLTALKEYIKVTYGKPGNVFLGLVHRLDRPVSGVMVFAKTSKAASRISEQIRKREVTKLYRAVTEGIPEPRSGRYENWCTKDQGANTTTVSDKPINKDSKISSLSYEVSGTSSFGGKTVSLVNVRLETGRSHQIRSQMAYNGHPLLGDARYGTGSYKGDICLQSCYLAFRHPTKGEEMAFTMPIPNDGPWALFA